MTNLLEGIAAAIRGEFDKGRTHVEVARELKVAPRTVCAIVWQERAIGPKTLEAIVAANPPWLLGVVLAALGRPEEGNGGQESVAAGPAGERRLRAPVVDLAGGERGRARKVVGIVIR